MMKVNKRMTALFFAVMSMGLLKTNLYAGCNNADGTQVILSYEIQDGSGTAVSSPFTIDQVVYAVLTAE